MLAGAQSGDRHPRPFLAQRRGRRDHREKLPVAQPGHQGTRRPRARGLREREEVRYTTHDNPGRF